MRPTSVLLVLFAAAVAAVGLWFLISGILTDADDPFAANPAVKSPAGVREDPDEPAAPGPPPAMPPSVAKATPKIEKPPVETPPAKPRIPIDPARFRIVSAFRDIPIEGATVTIRVAAASGGGTGAVVATHKTDVNGQFPLPDGWSSGALHVEMAGFAATDFAIENETVVGDGVGAGKMLRLKPTASIAGFVYDTLRNPLDWARIDLGVLIDDGYGEILALQCGARSRVFTKGGGAFELNGLDPRGRYLVIATLGRLGVTAKPDVMATVGVGKGVELLLGGQGALTVSIADEKGSAIKGAKAMLSGRPDGLPGNIVADPVTRGYGDLIRRYGVRFHRTAFSGADPTRFPTGAGFAFQSLPAGTYSLTVLARGFETAVESIRINDAEAVSRTLQMKLTPVAVSGVVSDSVGMPVAGAQLSVVTDGSTFGGYRETATKRDGSFEIHGPAEWKIPLRVTVTATGFAQIEVFAAVGQKRLDVKMVRNGVVGGSVDMENDPEGPVALEFVRTRPTPILLRRRLEVRLQWKQFRYDLPPGTWSVRVTAPGYRDHRVRSFEVPAGGECSLGRIFLRSK